MKNIATLLFILLSILSQGQISNHNFKHHVKTTPLALYYRNNPSIRIAYELKFNDRFGIQVGAGYIYTLYDYKDRNLTESKNSGYILSTELRSYFYSNPRSDGVCFSGLRGVLIDSDNTRKMRFRETSLAAASPEYFTEFVRFQKKIYGAQLILGARGTAGDHFFLEGVVGLGTSYRYVNNNTPESYPDPVFDQDWFAIQQKKNKNFDDWFTPYTYFQIHVGYGW